jgi:hypothetical protein
MGGVAVIVALDPDAVPCPEAMPLGFVNVPVTLPPGPTPIEALRLLHWLPEAKMMFI